MKEKNRLMQIQEKVRGGQKLLCAYLTYGYPKPHQSEGYLKVFEEEGVDIVELGFPFSDPLADGPTIQKASEAALKNKISVEGALRLLKKMRRQGFRLPVIFFSYFNPIYAFGLKRFLKLACASGLDGVLVPDLPPDEEKDFNREIHHAGLSQVFLAAPTTHSRRIQKIARASDGFVYYVSLRGVTGVKGKIPGDLNAMLQKLKRASSKPVLVGFGVSSPEQVGVIAKKSDGVIIGSEIIRRIESGRGKTQALRTYLRRVKKILKSVSAS